MISANFSNKMVLHQEALRLKANNNSLSVKIKDKEAVVEYKSPMTSKSN
jgi:hypothetical protein